MAAGAARRGAATPSAPPTATPGGRWGGARGAGGAPTTRHPFGFGRERYFWSFVVALVIFSVGALFALFEAEEKLRHPHELESPLVAVGILTLAIAFESFSLRTAVRESRGPKGGASWWSFIRHSRSPELPVVLLEDLGALVGLAFALAGVVLADVTGNARFDAVGSLAIGLLLAVIAVILMIEMKSLLMGESATDETEQLIREAVEAQPRVRRLIHMRTQHLGPEELLVAIKIELDGDLDTRAIAASIDEVEARVREAVPLARVMYVEPDLSRSQ